MEKAKYMHTMNMINKHILKKMIKINTVFQNLDDSGDGQVDCHEFKKGLAVILQKADFELSNNEMSEVFSTIDCDNSGHISYKEFARELKNSDPVRQASILAKSKIETLDQKQEKARVARAEKLEIQRRKNHQVEQLEENADPLAAVSEKARKFLAKNMQKAINLFRKMDTSGDGLIDQNELRVGLKTLGLILNDNEFNGLWSGLDADGSGACDLKELEAALRDTDPARKAALAKFSRPPYIKPRNSLSRAQNVRSRRMPGSLSWIMSPGTPKVKRRQYNPAYSLLRGSSSDEIGWRHPGSVGVNFPTAYRPVKPVLPEINMTVNLSPEQSSKLSMVGGIQTSPLRAAKSMPSLSPSGSRVITRRLTESAAKRTRNKRFWKKVQKAKDARHKPSTEEKVLRCIAMREGYLHALWSAFELSRPISEFQDSGKGNTGDGSSLKSRQRKVGRGRNATANSQKKKKAVKVMQQRKRNIYKENPTPRGDTTNSHKSRGTLGSKSSSRSWISEISRSSMMNGGFEKKKKTKQKYMHIKMLRTEVASLIEELQRVTCETVEQISDWRLEKARGMSMDNEKDKSKRKLAPDDTSMTKSDPALQQPFMWNRTNYLVKMGVDLNFLEPHRELCVQAMKRFYRLRVSRQQAMQLDTSENNPLEMLSTEMLMSLTRRIDDFPAFFDKHDKSGDGKLQRGEFNHVIKDMGLSLTNAQMTELYFVLDRDGDGEIDTKELLRALTDTRRAAQIGWIRFEEAETIILNELSRVMPGADGLNGISPSQLRGIDGGGSVQSDRSDRTNETAKTTPANVGHTEFFRMLLHARAEFDLSYPNLKNSIHPRAAARQADQVASSSDQNFLQNNLDSRERGIPSTGDDYYEEYSESQHSYSDNSEDMFRAPDGVYRVDSSESSGSYQEYQNYQDYLSDGQYSDLSYSDNERIVL